MTKIYFLAISILIPNLFNGCSKTQLQPKPTPLKFGECRWTNEHTFRMSTLSVSKKGETNPRKQKEQARNAALNMAKKTIIDKFVGARILGGMTYEQNLALTGETEKEFKKDLESGKIVYERFQFIPEERILEMEIHYEISSPNLKKRVMQYRK